MGNDLPHKRNLSTVRAAQMIMSSDPRHPKDEREIIRDLNDTKTSFKRYDNDMYMRNTIQAGRMEDEQQNSNRMRRGD